MNFLDFEDDIKPLVVKERLNAYNKFLRKNSGFFPQAAYEFAIADWHYNPSDSRCPHDAWVESLQISEKHNSETDKKEGIKIQLILLGAYHDGQIKIQYEGVKGYNLNLLPDSFEVKHHGDWLIDEIRISEKGWLVHEIKFSVFGKWQIECENINYEWLPFDTKNQDNSRSNL